MKRITESGKKAVPVTTTRVPPLTEPMLGTTLVNDGFAKKEKPPDKVDDCPLVLLTVTSADPIFAILAGMTVFADVELSTLV